MAATNISFARSTLIMLTVGVLILLGIVASTIWLVTESRQRFDNVVAARSIRAATQPIFSQPCRMPKQVSGAIFSLKRTVF